jgi:prophage regulatory protein
MAYVILRLPAVKARTGLSRSTIYQRISQGTFPKPLSLGARAVGWLESEIDKWLSNRLRARESRDALDTSSRNATVETNKTGETDASGTQGYRERVFGDDPSDARSSVVGSGGNGSSVPGSVL